MAPSSYKTHPMCSINNRGFYRGQLFTEKKPCHSSFRVPEIGCNSGKETFTELPDTQFYLELRN